MFGTKRVIFGLRSAVVPTYSRGTKHDLFFAQRTDQMPVNDLYLKADLFLVNNVRRRMFYIYSLHDLDRHCREGVI